ncbi:hypothetical protein CONPUDRAFT_44048, partial [Coniophora puteana RWD-64-598 SS2]
CSEGHYSNQGQPHYSFQYILLILWLFSLFLNPEPIQKMHYQCSYNTCTSGVADVFNGEHYCGLLSQHVQVGA